MPATFRAWVSLIVALYLLGFHFLNTVHFRQHKPITKHTVYFVSSHTWLSLASFYLGQRWRSQEHQVVVLRTSKYLEDLRQRSCVFFFARSLAMCVCMFLNVSSSYVRTYDCVQPSSNLSIVTCKEFPQTQTTDSSNYDGHATHATLQKRTHVYCPILLISLKTIPVVTHIILLKQNALSSA